MQSQMNFHLKIHHHHHQIFSAKVCPRFSVSPTTLSYHRNALAVSIPLSFHRPKAPRVSISDTFPPYTSPEEEEELTSDVEPEKLDDLATDGPVYQNTLRLVECSMLAAVAGLAYFISNSLAIENYFGCFFALPIVVSSMRWGVAGGRKTMVATAVLLFVLSGPVKALTYMLMHGLLGFTMGSLWRLKVNWSLSIFLCTLVRAVGAVGYVLTSSFLIQENILALITINVHATLTLIFNSLGFNTVPSMSTIYVIFSTLLLINCCFFVFLLHILYGLFLTRLGMKDSLRLPRWLAKAL